MKSNVFSGVKKDNGFGSSQSEQLANITNPNAPAQNVFTFIDFIFLLFYNVILSPNNKVLGVLASLFSGSPADHPEITPTFFNVKFTLKACIFSG